MPSINLHENKLTAAHKHCTYNRKEITASDICGCFYCLKTFSSSEVGSWLEEDTTEKETDAYTALCPYCNIDSVIGSKSGYPIDEFFLSEMNKLWFAVDSEPDTRLP